MKDGRKVGRLVGGKVIVGGRVDGKSEGGGREGKNKE